MKWLCGTEFGGWTADSEESSATEANNLEGWVTDLDGENVLGALLYNDNNPEEAFLFDTNVVGAWSHAATLQPEEKTIEDTYGRSALMIGT